MGYMSKITVTICICLCLIGIKNAHAQSWNIGVQGGGLYYLGDLAPLASIFSLSKVNPGIAFSIGTKRNDFLEIDASFLYGRLSGTDVDAKNMGRRVRNLSFDTSLYEFGVGVNIHLNKWLKVLDKYGINLYYTTGLSIFHFNPKAYYQGRFVELQPLGTEGQGAPSLNSNAKYRLTQVSIPFGVGVNFDLSDEFLMGVQVVPRWTFTDYIDDVSGAYIPYSELEAANGTLAARLSDRTAEYLGTTHTDRPDNALRGDPENADWYMYTSVYLKYRWQNDTEDQDEINKELIESEN